MFSYQFLSRKTWRHGKQIDLEGFHFRKEFPFKKSHKKHLFSKKTDRLKLLGHIPLYPTSPKTPSSLYIDQTCFNQPILAMLSVRILSPWCFFQKRPSPELKLPKTCRDCVKESPPQKRTGLLNVWFYFGIFLSIKFHHHHPFPNLTAARSALGILDGTINRTSSLQDLWMRRRTPKMGSWSIHTFITPIIVDYQWSWSFHALVM